ncbi:nucleoside/nucleotide kinase family protein [Frondihabitans sp. PAMC 28766]|nr:nucleoside/nucleotide kinase family protein [Frondihabitans sp. PAMC 28766]
MSALLDGGDRVLLGIVGSPGAGKSTLAEAVVSATTAQGVEAAWLPMDGFHLADVELDRLGLRARKGAEATFDAAGYVAILRRVVARQDAVVYAPAFDRTLEQPVAGSIPIPSTAQLVVTEGNYLLADGPRWGEVSAILTESWFCTVDDELRRERLRQRHVRFGKTPQDATAWVAQVDEPNAVAVAATRPRATVVLSPSADGRWDLVA